MNSPAKVARYGLAGRVLVQCTTNGTAGVLAAWRAQPLYCAGFVVARATARALAAAAPTVVTYVITGGGGHADEDRACADYISALIDDPSTDAVSFCERASNAPSAAELRRGVELGYEGVDVEDVDYCLDADRFDFALLAVPELDTISIHRVPVGHA